MNRYYWTGYSKLNQYQFGSQVLPVINNYGSIININRFSDLALGMIIEINGEAVAGLYRDLSPYCDIPDYKAPDSEMNESCYIILSITFIEGTGDLKIEVPSVPG